MHHGITSFGENEGTRALDVILITLISTPSYRL